MCGRQLIGCGSRILRLEEEERRTGLSWARGAFEGLVSCKARHSEEGPAMGRFLCFQNASEREPQRDSTGCQPLP